MRPGLLCFNYSSCQKKKITSILMAGAADRGALVGCWEQVEEKGGGGGGGREGAREMEEGKQGLSQRPMGEPGWLPWAGEKDPPDPVALIPTRNSSSSPWLLPLPLGRASPCRDRLEECSLPGRGAESQLRASSSGHAPQHGAA